MAQLDMNLAAGADLEWLPLERGRLGWQPDYVPCSEQLYQQLAAELQWQQPLVKVFGREHPVPRRVAFYGDEGIVYGYSSLQHRAAAWPESLEKLRDRLQRDIGCEFNCVLVNWYRDGRDSMGFHSDNETELGRNPCIASISLGASRRFVLRPRPRVNADKKEMLLTCGSLLVMAGETQHYWQHGLPRQLSCAAGRINLTFRKIQDTAAQTC